MVRTALAGLIACVSAPCALAQAPQANSNPTQPLLNPLLFTGTPIGKPILTPIGSQFQKVGQQPGQNIGSSQPVWRQDPLPPGGQLINLKNSVAPVPTASLPPVLRQQEPKSVWEQLYNKWSNSLGLTKPEEANSGYIPGMTRRAKERRERKWIWD